MTLTTDDLRRPAIKRIAHTITVLSTPVWVVPALVAMLCSAVAFVFTLVAMGTHWLMNQVFRPLEELKWRAAEAYVKRWPTVQPRNANAFCSAHGGHGLVGDCVECNPTGKADSELEFGRTRAEWREIQRTCTCTACTQARAQGRVA